MSSDPIIKKYPQKKQLMFEELQELPKTYNVIALSKTKLHRELLKN